MVIWASFFTYLFHVDVAKGESLDYAAAIAQKFAEEFPNARLTIAYDIACKLKNCFDVSRFLKNLLFYLVLEFKCEISQIVFTGDACILS